jgi:hypothetical protein
VIPPRAKSGPPYHGRPRLRVPAALAITLMTAAGCGGSDDDAPRRADAAPPVDAQVLADAGTDAANGPSDAGIADAGIIDAGLPDAPIG